MENWVEKKLKMGRLNIFCLGLDGVKGSKPVYKDDVGISINQIFCYFWIK
jgi:hypothetical protein